MNCKQINRAVILKTLSGLLQIITAGVLWSPTWVLDRVNGDLVVGFAGTQSRHHVLDPPQLALHLSFLLLQFDTCTLFVALTSGLVKLGCHTFDNLSNLAYK